MNVIKRIKYLYQHRNEIIEGWYNYFRLKIYRWNVERERKKRLKIGRGISNIFYVTSKSNDVYSFTDSKIETCNGKSLKRYKTEFDINEVCTLED